MVQQPRSNQKGKRTISVVVIIAVGSSVVWFSVGVIGRESRLAVTAGVAFLVGKLLGSEIEKSLDKADLLYQEQATQAALEHNKSGQATTWKNPDTDHGGSVTPVKTVEANGKVCREFTQTVTIEGKPETTTGKACRDKQGWIIE